MGIERHDRRGSGWLARAWRWGPLVAAMIAIFIVSGTPNLAELPGGLSDKVWHSLTYGGLGLLAIRATAGARWTGVTAVACMAAWLVCAAYGASDEVHQRFVEGRTADPLDWMADVSGAAAAISLVFLVARRRRGRTATL